MNGLELAECMKEIVERLERQPRFSLAWVLAYGLVLDRVRYVPVEQWPAAIEREAASLMREIAETNKLIKLRRCATVLRRLNAGLPLPARRRRARKGRKAKRAP